MDMYLCFHTNVCSEGWACDNNTKWKSHKGSSNDRL